MRRSRLALFPSVLLLLAVPLAVGQRIGAFVDPASSPLKATSIVVFEQKGEVALTGPVQAVAEAAKTLQLLGFAFRVDRDTVFGGPWDGAGQAGLEDVRGGDLVLVAATADAGRRPRCPSRPLSGRPASPAARGSGRGASRPSRTRARARRSSSPS